MTAIQIPEFIGVCWSLALRMAPLSTKPYRQPVWTKSNHLKWKCWIHFKTRQKYFERDYLCKHYKAFAVRKNWWIGNYLIVLLINQRGCIKAVFSIQTAWDFVQKMCCSKSKWSVLFSQCCRRWILPQTLYWEVNNRLRLDNSLCKTSFTSW